MGSKKIGTRTNSNYNSNSNSSSSSSSITDLQDQVQYLLKYVIVPGFIIVSFPFLGVLLAVYAQDDSLTRFRVTHFIGNQFTWTFIFGFTGWALVFQKFTTNVYYGPTTNYGYTPRYAGNGFAYFWSTTGAFLTLNFLTPALSTRLVRDLPLLVGNLVTVAFIFCLYLWYKGRNYPTCPKDVKMVIGDRKRPPTPPIFEFYRGMELHPRMLDVDIKQLIVCRVSLMLWQIFILAFLIAGYHQNGGTVNPGHAVNVLAQTVYLIKFYCWETGYFNTLDITLDRAGFYICWGCLGFLPIGYTYSSYYFVYHPPEVSATTAIVLFVVSVAAILLNYEVDRQKQLFQKTDGKCQIFGSDARYMEVRYRSNSFSAIVDGDGAGATHAVAAGTSTSPMKKSKLLLSGFWGIARHLNYAFELVAALAWNLPGWNLGPLPFFYNVFLSVLLVHRVFRDEAKCEDKYGSAWKTYCKAVPYRLIPYIF